MGTEATCRIETAQGSGEARVLLETDEILIRGPLRARIPLASVTGAEAGRGRLVLSHAGGPTILHLGSDAGRWAERILHPKSRLEKLGVKSGSVVSIQGLRDAALRSELDALGTEVSWGRLRRASDFILIGVERSRDLSRIGKAVPFLRPNGALWVVHPKGKDGIKDTEVFAAGTAAGLVATKVARFSGTHTAEKLVIPVARRPRA